MLPSIVVHAYITGLSKILSSISMYLLAFKPYSVGDCCIQS